MAGGNVGLQLKLQVTVPNKIPMCSALLVAVTCTFKILPIRWFTGTEWCTPVGAGTRRGVNAYGVKRKRKRECDIDRPEFYFTLTQLTFAQSHVLRLHPKDTAFRSKRS